MNAQERRERAERIARERKDRAAIAIIEGGRRYVPEPPDHLIFSAPLVRSGLRWAA